MKISAGKLQLHDGKFLIQLEGARESAYLCQMK